ncbi:hypothetical protein KGQ71_01055 [Patescibacteria group bacterium]|nr:hypothetical protein [Patescibacteria group bacterium]
MESTPPAYLFRGQLSNEEVVLLTRQHPFILLPAMLLSIAILLIPLLLYVFLPFDSIIAYAIVICLIVAIMNGYRAWHRWNNSLLMLTNRRIVIARQKGMLNHEVSDSNLEHIHRVTHEVKGLLPTLFNYGPIRILTDDLQTALIMPAIPNPYDIQQEILRVTAGEEFQPDDPDQPAD